MVEFTSTIPGPESMAQFCVVVLAIIVAWDAWWLARQQGHTHSWRVAWWWLCMAIQSIGGGITAMGQFDDCRCNDGSYHGCLPSYLTPMIWVWIWDTLLAIHLISLLIPKRYAVTSTHLFADGQRYEWNRLRLAKKQPKENNVVAQRVGPFRTPTPGRRLLSCKDSINS